MCATHLTYLTHCSTCNNCDKYIYLTFMTYTQSHALSQTSHIFDNKCILSDLDVGLDIDSNHKCWQKKSPKYQRKENLPLELKISETPRCRITSWCKQYQPACVWLFSTPCVCLTQTISAGLPPAPLLVDIISLFTKLTIARAGWSRSSSANTWHWKCVTF